MPSRIAALLVGLMLLPAVLAQEPAAWADKLFQGQTGHDFGTVAHGTLLKHSFTITNIYKVPLDITEVRGSCGCVKAEASVKSLQPGASGTINVTVDTRQFVGARSVKVFVTVGPKFVSMATLNLSANAQGDVTFTPNELNFGSVPRGQTPSKSIDIEYTGNVADWKVVEILKSAAAPFELKPEPLPAVNGQARRGYRVTATLRDNAAAGSFKQEVTLKTNSATAPVMTFHVAGEIQAGLSIAPSTIAVNGLKVGESQTKKVFIRGPKAFKIVGVDGQGDGIKVDFPSKQDPTHVLSVRIDPTKAGPLRRTLTIRTDLDRETVAVIIEGSIEP